MDQNMRINLGTVVTVAIFLLTQTGAFLWWASAISSDVKATRAWQVRQDDRLAKLESKTDALQVEGAATNAMLQSLMTEVEENREEILRAIRQRGLLPPSQQ